MKVQSLTEFHDFKLNDAIARALTEEKYATPTPIQAQTIPTVMAGRDVVGIAQTGTGKTAAFALPILHRLAAAPRALEHKICRVLVLSPTRELSGQILDSFRAYGRHLRLRSALAIGGVSMGAQVRSLMHGVDVLVATPGRLLDLVQGNALRLNGVECFVLDEADRMLDMGFIADIRKIVAKLPANRQTLMFSATMPGAIADLAAHMLRDPVKVAVTPTASTAERIDQRIIRVDRAAKPAILVDLLRQETIDRALVFTRTKHGADKVVRRLNGAGIAAEAIHGNKSQGQRERVLAAFRSGKVRTLVATDIAARGIDVDGISHVVNFDLPNVPETYVHRIGRTARAGAEGIAISLCDTEEMAFLRDIERLIRMSLPMSDRRAHPQRAEAPPAKAEPRRHNGHQHNREGRRPHGNGAGKPSRYEQSRHGQSQHGQSHRSQQNRIEPHNGQHHNAQPRNGRPHADQKQNSDIGAVAFLRRDAAADRRRGAPRFTDQSRGS
ncbi:MAG TPA: DEAD/DEAH box helicase [Xanthobacteraceae bacterium]|nr:DEAD/DEAH box helicase [Xanthobacteraceae bacterium]